MTTYQLKPNDEILLIDKLPIWLTPRSSATGLPLATEFQLSLKNIEKSWYEASKRFGPYNYHPERCQDWNLESGGDTDLGEPLVAPFSGIVLSAHDFGGGRGKIIQILGVNTTELIIWMGWHLEDINVQLGQIVRRGDDIGTIGNANGVYAAHLHEQICIVNSWGIPSPDCFAADPRYNFFQPSLFYLSHGVDKQLIKRVTEFDSK